MTYYLVEIHDAVMGKTSTYVRQQFDDGSYKSFPVDDLDNPDTQAFLAWVDEGGKPQPWKG